MLLNKSLAFMIWCHFDLSYSTDLTWMLRRRFLQAIVLETTDNCNDVCYIACITHQQDMSYPKFHTDTSVTFHYVKQYCCENIG